MWQLSEGGCQFYAGKGLPVKKGEKAGLTKAHIQVAGAVAAALHTHAMAKLYGGECAARDTRIDHPVTLPLTVDFPSFSR